MGMRGPQPMPLTPAQIRVLLAAEDGASLPVVARRVGNSSTYVSARLSEAYSRLHIPKAAYCHRKERRAVALAEARRLGLIPQ